MLVDIDTPTASRFGHPLRVCFIIDSLAAAGTESQLLMLIRGLDRDKIRPYLCLLDGTGEASQTLEPDDCAVLRIGVRSFKRPSTVGKLRQFVRFLRREKIDVLQTHFPDSTYFGVLAGKLARVPRIVRTRRSLGYSTTRGHRLLGRLCGRFVGATVANCEACRRSIIQQEGARPDSVVVIGNGIDLTAFANLRPLEPSKNGRPREVGMVANLRPIKGPDVFVRAAGLLRDKHPNVRFRMAGEGDRQSVLKLARECEIEGRLELLGSVANVPRFLEGLDVAVLTSRSEGLSNSLLEYMAAGRPIVATAVGGNVELIEDGVTGLLVPPDDPEAVAAAVDRLLSDPALADRLGDAARRHVENKYSLARTARGHEEFFLGLHRRWQCGRKTNPVGKCRSRQSGRC